MCHVMLTGWTIHHGGGGGGHLHDHGALAGESPLLPHPLPPALLQTRHQAAHPRPGETQRSLQVRVCVCVMWVCVVRVVCVWVCVVCVCRVWVCGCVGVWCGCGCVCR